MAEKKTAAATGNDIPKTSLTSSVTSDLPATAPAGDGMTTVDLSKAEIRVPASSVAAPPAAPGELSASEEADIAKRGASFEQRAIDASIGLVRVDGIDFRYIGVAPARDTDPKTASGYPVTTDNSTFTPLSAVTFHPSVRIKDPASGEYYYPADGVTSYDQAEYEGSPLIAREADSEADQARRDAALEAKSR